MKTIKKEWIAQKHPEHLPNPDPAHYLYRLSAIELFDLAERLNKSKHWKQLCWRVHQWTFENGWGCSFEQTECVARNILLKYIAKGFIGTDGYNASWSMHKCTMKELGYKSTKMIDKLRKARDKKQKKE